MKPLVILLARVSSKRQKEQGFSIPAQLRKGKKYIQENLKLPIYKIYEISETASKREERKIFSQMLDLIENGKKYILVVEKSDRLQRNLADAEILDELCEQGSLAIHFIDEHYVYDKDSGCHDWLVRKLGAVIATYRVKLDQKEAKKGTQEKLELGGYPGYAPIGYLNNIRTHEIETDPDRFDLVKRGFHLFLTGDYSIEGLTKEYKHIGLVTRSTRHNGRTGLPLSKGEVHRMLKNPFYYGHFRWSGKLWSNRGINNDRSPSYPPMITKSEHNQIKEILTGNAVNKSGQYGEEHLLKGLIKCECGRTPVWMPKTKVLKTTNEKVSYYYFYCQKCRISFKLDDIERAIIRDIGLFFPDKTELKKLIASLGEKVRETQTAVNNELQYLHKRYTEIGKIIDGLSEKLAITCYETDREEFLFTQIEKLTTERDELKSQIREFEDQNDDSLDNAVEFIELANDFKTKYLQSDMKTRHRMLKLMYRTIEVRKTEKYVLDKSPHMRFYLTHNEVFEGLFVKGLDRHAVEWWEENRRGKEVGLVWRGRRDLNSRPLA